MGTYTQHIASVLGGNKQAYARLVALFSDMAHSIAAPRLGDEALAQDAVQEAFLTAYLKLPQLRDPAAFPGWFRTILVRQCARTGRQQTQALPPNGADPDEAACDEDFSPHRIYTRRLDRDMVRRILGDLPGAAREACILRFVHGQRYEEIAKALGVPQGTVKRRIHDSRDKIVAELTRHRATLLRVGYLPISDHLLAMVAHCRREDTEDAVRLSRFLSWNSLAQALARGTLDAAFVMVPLAMHMRSQGVPLIYVLDGHHDGSAITVRKDMPGGALPGARLGLPHAASTHRMYLRCMTGSGAGPGAMTNDARYISPSYMDRFFADRVIDGFFCAEPWNTKSELEGLGRVLARSADFAPGHVCCGLTVREEFAARHGDLLHDYLSGLLAAAEFTARHPGESAQIQQRCTGISRDVARHVLERGFVSFRDLVPDRGRVERAMRLALDAAILDTPCDLDAFLHAEYA